MLGSVPSANSGVGFRRQALRSTPPKHSGIARADDINWGAAIGSQADKDGRIHRRLHRWPTHERFGCLYKSHSLLVMDAQYVNGTIYHENHRQAFPSLPQIQSQYSHISQQIPHTLPPLQPQRAALAFANDLFSQNPRSLHSPNAPQNGQFNDYVSHGQPRQLPVQAAYPPVLHQYSNTSAYNALPPHTLPYDQNHTSTLTQTSLPDIRSVPLNSINQPPILATGYDSALSFSVQSTTPEQPESPRSHVVGSQGRRGILPSAAGRPDAATVEGNASAKSSVVPNKDADGKYPCPHCNKTYLHAKHLKRHLLRRE